ncbi:DMT family transporter [Deinococcus wulumuqiensis]|uniref:DMT family transporter n=1 Tax=Deinococcus wulumuqiensis TaxID=980427 RepID=A0A345IFX2_9DEIO|nr:DMT family transporter [Deinococcus wulumuqiensis]AXG98594.1 DMT family transporter [Deinococcus wulumuqiensis]
MPRPRPALSPRAPSPRALPLPPLPALLLAMLSIQGGAAFAKSLFPALGPGGTTALRVTLAAALLLLAFRPNLRALTRADWQAIVPYGVALGLMNLSFYFALQRLPLGLAVTLEFVGPLLLSLFLSRRVTDVGWVLLAAVGIALIAPVGESAGHLDLPGAGLALLAGAFWVAYILAGGAVGRRVPGVTGVVAGMLVAALVALPFGVAQAGSGLLRPDLLLAGLAVALFSSALPYSLEMAALRAIPPRVFGVLMSMEPAIAALSGWLLLHEALSLRQWLALLCVAVASAGISLTARRPDTESAAI